jgi:hypothetical protein
MLGFASPDMAEKARPGPYLWPASGWAAQPAFSDTSCSLVSQASTVDVGPDGTFAAAGLLSGGVEEAAGEYGGNGDQLRDAAVPDTDLLDGERDADRYQDICWVLDHDCLGNVK